MTTKHCRVDGCDRPSRALGMCTMHYQRVQNKGDAGNASSQRSGVLGACVVDEREKVARSSGSPYCEMRYYRLRRTGQLAAGPWHRRGPCAVDGCNQVEDELGYCPKHAARVKRHGSPDVVIAHKDRNLPAGAAHHFWTGDQATYKAVHQRVAADRGPASDYSCIDCGGQAAQWSYDRNDAEERQSDQGHPYSLDPDHYVPRCISCHKKFDLSAKRVRVS